MNKETFKARMQYVYGAMSDAMIDKAFQIWETNREDFFKRWNLCPRILFNDPTEKESVKHMP